MGWGARRATGGRETHGVKETLRKKSMGKGTRRKETEKGGEKRGE